MKVCSMWGVVLLVGVSAYLFAPVVAEDTMPVPQPLPAAAEWPVYAYAVNGHVLRVENKFNSKVIASYDGVGLEVVCNDGTWTASNETGSVSFEGFFYDFYDHEEVVPVANVTFTGTSDDFVETEYIEVVADEELAEIFDVEVNTVLAGDVTVIQWDLKPAGWSWEGGGVTLLRAMEYSDAMTAVKCGCFRGGGTCTQSDCDDSDTCGTNPSGVCMEFDSA